MRSGKQQRSAATGTAGEAGAEEGEEGEEGAEAQARKRARTHDSAADGDGADGGGADGGASEEGAAHAAAAAAVCANESSGVAGASGHTSGGGGSGGNPLWRRVLRACRPAEGKPMLFEVELASGGQGPPQTVLLPNTKLRAEAPLLLLDFYEERLAFA